MKNEQFPPSCIAEHIVSYGVIAGAVCNCIGRNKRRGKDGPSRHVYKCEVCV